MASLKLPADGATGFPPLLPFNGPMAYRSAFVHQLVVFDGPDFETAKHVWQGYAIDRGNITYSLSIPVYTGNSPQYHLLLAVRSQPK